VHRSLERAAESLDGLKVAVVDAQNTVRLRNVKLGRDFGSSVEVLSGLDGNETWS